MTPTLAPTYPAAERFATIPPKQQLRSFELKFSASRMALPNGFIAEFPSMSVKVDAVDSDHAQELAIEYLESVNIMHGDIETVRRLPNIQTSGWNIRPQ